MIRQKNLRQYFLLIRLPNVFTALTNILVGYFSVTPISEANPFQLILLFASSSLLYVGGVISNDLADYRVDLYERPSRPLPSGRISRTTAIMMALVAFATANLIAALVSIPSFLISMCLTATIIMYDFITKPGSLGPFTMGIARFLNVFLGASAALFGASPQSIWNLFFSATAILAYVYSITLLSRVEINPTSNYDIQRKHVNQAFSLVFAVILSTILFAFYQKQFLMLVNIGIFSIVIFFAWKSTQRLAGITQVQVIQRTVKILVLSIIILDSIFITAYAGLVLGLISLVTLVPPTIISKRFYVT